MKKYSKLLIMFCVFLDFFIIIGSYYFSEWLWLHIVSNESNIVMQYDLRNYVHLVVALFSAVLVTTFAFAGVYKSQRFNKIWRAWGTMVLIDAVWIFIAMALLFTYRVVDFSRGVLLVFGITTCITLFLRHIICHLILRMIRRLGFNQRYVVLIGSGKLAQDYSRTIKTNPRYGIVIDGYFSQKESRDMSDKYVGNFSDLENYISGDGIDEVIIALDEQEVNYVTDIIACCEKCGTRVSVIPYYNNMISDKPQINTVGKMKCFALRSSPLDNLMGRFFKRTFDILFSLFVIILLSPVLLVVAVMVKLSSPGPVIFKQARVGKDKKQFTMYKFRSMRVNSESSTAWSSDKDPRKTWFGSFIRKTSIDELPQFFNVLRGDMSIIGPRPEIPYYVDQFKETIPRYMLKHLVRPGITGWAQVNGYRGDTSIEERIKHDIWYIENWSAGLDAKIIFMTVFGGMINSEKIGRQK